jgi:DNA-binding IclR family transcriptional regulator
MDAVKSARRVLEIFEFFDNYRREATVIEISEALSYPQSSTSALLKSLVNMGYLTHDPYKRTYISSPRVALLGFWVSSLLTSGGGVLQMMRDLNEETRLHTTLVGRNGVYLQYLHVVPAKDPLAEQVAVGYRKYLTLSAAGHSILSSLPDQEVTKLAMRINAEIGPKGDPVVNIKELLKIVDDVRQLGYAAHIDPTVWGGAVHVPLPTRVNEQFMAVGLVAKREYVMDHVEELARILLDAVQKHFPGTPPSQLSESALRSGNARTS